MTFSNSHNRRRFLEGSSLAILAGSFATSNAIATEKSEPFRLAFAPHPSMFKTLGGDNVLDQIRFAHDQGFTAWEHNPMPTEEPALQEKIGQLLRDLKMRMGVFVGYSDFERPTFAVKKTEYRDEVLGKIKQAVEVAGRCGATHFTVVPGTVDQQSIHDKQWNKYGGPRISEGYQLANVIDLLRECVSILEPNKLTMVLEPLNWRANHGGVFLQKSDQAIAICRAVNSPSCKSFVFGMEHGNSMRSKEGEQAVIDAYRAIDPS